MGRYFQFYLEELTTEGWRYTMPDPDAITQNPYGAYTYPFYQLRYDPYIDGLFLGDNSVFEFTFGIPPNIDPPLLKHITNDFGSKHWFIAVEELMVDDWSNLRINVCQSVKQSEATKFADGRLLYSREQLLQLPVEFAELDDDPGHVVARPINLQVNPQPLYHPSFEGLVEVSWQMLVSEFLPNEFMQQMRLMIDNFEPQKLRLYIIYHNF